MLCFNGISRDVGSTASQRNRFSDSPEFRFGFFYFLHHTCRVCGAVDAPVCDGTSTEHDDEKRWVFFLLYIHNSKLTYKELLYRAVNLMAVGPVAWRGPHVYVIFQSILC